MTAALFDDRMLRNWSADVFSTVLGPMVGVSNGSALVALAFCEEAEWPTRVTGFSQRFSATLEVRKDPVLREAHGQVAAFLAGDRRNLDLPLELVGTDFQRRVWQALTEIPFGETISYGGLSDRLGLKYGQRAVGKANADNPLHIVVPCHRVVSADGDLCGYAGGRWRKQRLLALESGQPSLW